MMRDNAKSQEIGRGVLPTSCCPVCRYEMECATSLEKIRRVPIAGDLSICLNCGEILQFNDILVAKPIPKELLSSLDDQTKELLIKARTIIKARGQIPRIEKL